MPPAYDPAALLQDAVGAARPTKSRKPSLPDEDYDVAADDDDEPPAKKRSRRATVFAALVIIAGIAIAALVFLGRANAQRYLIACTADHVAAERGRAFPPWGSLPMSGPEWKPIALPANAECKPRETEQIAELEFWFLELLVERASTTLTTPNLLDAITAPAPGTRVPNNPLDVAAEQLNQALLLSRAPERRDRRKEIERLLGDVQYWRASLRLRDASAALLDAGRQFDAAAQQRPRHVTDASAWGTFVRKLADDLRAGPGGVPATTPAEPGSERPAVPTGTELPVEPEAGSAVEPAPPATPDAGVPTGGVLL